MSNSAGSPSSSSFPPIDALQRGLQNYVNFEGRANRPEFWWWVLAVIVISIVANIIDAILGIGLLSLIVGLALLLPGLAVSVRRLHDTNRSGWWILISLVPIVGFILLIIWYAQPGTPGPNDHGEPSTFLTS